jgi:Ca-activated chloride channel family protein
MWNKLTDISIFEYEYVHKEMFWLLLIIPILVIWFLYKESHNDKNINISDLNNFSQSKFNWVKLFRYLNFFISMFAIAFIVAALAKPQSPKDVEEYKKKSIEGIDVVLAIDVSGSMLAEDFKPNRLESAKETALDFIDERPNDRIGLVVYEGEAYTQAPLTTDHQLLHDLFEQVESGKVTPGTAIGSGLLTAVNRLRDSDAKSKVIILLTDGVNNSGDIDPLTAAEIAKEYGIRVYTIGVGKNGLAPIPVQTVFGTQTQQMEVEIDEKLLKQIANATDGKYFRARNEKELNYIYDEIDKLEKSKVKVLEYKIDPPEKFYGFLFFGLLIFLIYYLIDNTLLKSIH